MSLFVSLFAYAFGKQHWPNVDAAVQRELAAGESSSVPGFRTLYRLRKLTDVELHTDHSTLISRARDRASGRFLRSSCEQWVAIDDDVDASDEACAALLATKPDRILSLAMRMRSGDQGFNVGTILDGVGGGAVLPGAPFRVKRTGMGMIRFPRAELVAVAGMFHDNEWDEPSPDVSKKPWGLGVRGVDTSPGVFLPFVTSRQWLDDDWAFCARAELAEIDLWSVVLPGVSHAGIPNMTTRPPESRL